MKKRQTRTLWGQDFDVVKDGLAEHQVVALVEDLLKRYNDLLQEHKNYDSLQLLAERKLREAEKLAASILQEARAQATQEPPSVAPTGHDRRRASKKGHASAEPSKPGASSYKVDIVLQTPDPTAESTRVTSVLEHLQQSREMSLEGYVWLPSSGWVATVSVHTSRPVIPLLLAIPEVQRVAEGETESAGSVASPLQKGRNSGQGSGDPPRKRLIVCLKRGDAAPGRA